MRKSRRWMTLLGTGLAALVFLLLLSALVEAAPSEVPAVPTEASVGRLMLLPAIPPVAETSAQVRDSDTPVRAALLCALLALALPLMVRGSDANGRVLRKKRYARGYYLVFRQEIACG